MAMLGSLGENLTNTMKKLVGMSVIDKKTIKEVVKDIQRALIQSDVNIKLVLDLSAILASFSACAVLASSYSEFSDKSPNPNAVFILSAISVLFTDFK